MFPLGRPLFPGEPVALRVFEPRYLQMMTEILAGDGRFGTVLISHGSEVGGGDRRERTGTVVDLHRAVEIGEGTELGVVGTGRHRLRVATWHRDDPFPVADVHLLPDPPTTGTEVIDAVRSLDHHLGRISAMAAALGLGAGDVDRTLPDDPVAAVWQLCALAPIGALDRQRLLDVDDLTMRMDRLSTTFDEVEEDLRLRLSESG